ncbi:MAG: glycosyltransferase family 87 protein [Candidatus Sulfotelmatobacter sp.]
MIYYHQGLFMPRVWAVRTAEGLGNGNSFGNDFFQVWLTSQEWLRHGRDPYSPEMTREIQTGLYGRPLDPDRPTDPVDRRVFPYPFFADLLFWPAAEFPFAPLRVAVVCVLAALTFASVPLWLCALDWRMSAKWVAVILLLTLSSYPALEALFAAQLGLLVAFLLAASLVSLQRGRFLLAGILMSISTIKPQVTVLAILYFMIWSAHDWRARRGFCLGFFATLTLLLGTSLAAMPHWIESWTHTVLAYRHYTQPPLVTEVLTSHLGPHLAGPGTFVLTSASLVVAILLAWRSRAAAYGSFAFWMTLTLLLSITTITILPGQAIYDHLILLPGILVLVRYRSHLLDGGLVPRVLLFLGALVLFWPWIAAFSLILFRPVLAPVDFNSTAIALPIRTAASLPFAVLALLAWTARVKLARVTPLRPNLARSPESA